MIIILSAVVGLGMVQSVIFFLTYDRIQHTTDIKLIRKSFALCIKLTCINAIAWGCYGSLLINL